MRIKIILTTLSAALLLLGCESPEVKRTRGGGPGADPGTEIRANAWRRILPAAAKGDLHVPVARTYPLAQAAEAHRFFTCNPLVQ